MEIEVKAKLVDKERVMKQLNDLGCVFGAAVTQDDTVYVRETGSLEVFLSNDVFLRIRIQNDSKVILTAKKPMNKTTEQLVKYEHEVVVDSAQEAQGILELMGYHKAVRVKKIRQKAIYEQYEICIDEIEGLGAFIELERMASQEEAKNIQQQMSAFLETLGVRPEDQVKKGYDILVLEKGQV